MIDTFQCSHQKRATAHTERSQVSAKDEPSHRAWCTRVHATYLPSSVNGFEDTTGNGKRDRGDTF